MAAPVPAARRALVLTETKGFHHDSIADGKRLLRELDASDPQLRLTFLAGSRELTKKRLASARAIVFLNTSGNLPFTHDQRRLFLGFVRSGGGLVGFHAASDTFPGWPDFTQALGAKFSRHPFTAPGRVIVEDRSHPATAGLAASFSLTEEFYYFKRNPRRRAHVLARLDVGSVGGDPAQDRPLVWSRCEGRGRVFYDALGHFPATWSNPNQRQLVSGGVRWAVGLAGEPDC